MSAQLILNHVYVGSTAQPGFARTFTASQASTDYSQQAAAIHDTVSNGQRVLVIDAPDHMQNLLAILAYLVEYAGMTLPNAYTLLVSRYRMVGLDCRPLVAHYKLPYAEEVLTSGNLIAASRTMLSPVLPWLLISGFDAIERAAQAIQAGVEAVVRLDVENTAQWPAGLEVLRLPVEDGRLVASDVIRQGTGFIHHQQKAGRRVLVHCNAGVSRSAMLVLAYLVAFGEYALGTAYAHLLTARPIARPHPSLMRSLVACYNLPYSLDQAGTWGFLDILLEDTLVLPSNHD